MKLEQLRELAKTNGEETLRKQLESLTPLQMNSLILEILYEDLIEMRITRRCFEEAFFELRQERHKLITEQESN